MTQKVKINEYILFGQKSDWSLQKCIVMKHLVKMILETAQMISTAHRVIDGDEYADRMGLYKMAHKNHPVTIWTRTSTENYMWHWTDCLVHCVASIPIDTKNTMHQKDY